jgi:hypothetical protein
MIERTISLAELTETRAQRVADRTKDAWSVERYGALRWRACAKMLLARGFTEREAEAILRSKWTRWAADNSKHPYGYTTSADLSRYIDTMTVAVRKRELARIVEETF